MEDISVSKILTFRTPDDKYSVRKRDNLPQPIQTQLPKNVKTFSEYLAQFLESKSNFSKCLNSPIS